MHPELDPDLGWVGALAGRNRPAAEGAVDEARGERRLFAHLDAEHRSERRESYVEIDAPLELYALTRLLRPRHALEVGVSSGVSTAYLLQALDRNGSGTLHSVDLPARVRRGTEHPPRASWSLPPGRSSGWAVPLRLRGRWDLRIGDKSAVLPLLARELPRIDLVVYDVPHDDRATGAEFRLLGRRFRSGTVVIVDHGPGGGACGALRHWSRVRGSPLLRRTGLGLYGLRWGPVPGPPPTAR